MTGEASTPALLTNAVIVTRDELLAQGTVLLENGTIRSVDDRKSHLAGAHSLDGDYLLPGLVDVHTDNVERHLFPRPGVRRPSTFGCAIAHDREIIAAGITTILDSLAFGDYDDASGRRQVLPDVVDSITTAKTLGMLHADHFLHFRCELTDEAGFELFEPRALHPLLRLVSLMDHTPGSRQFRDPALFRSYREKKSGRVWSDEAWKAYVADRQAFQTKHAARLKRSIVALALSRSLPIASHDDTTVDHVEEARRDGAVISEFPTTLEAADAARSLGLTTIMGAPNVVLGQSHSGNVSALELAAQGLLDALASDYIPASLLEAVFKLNAQMGIPLPAAVAMASATPATAIGLNDRGAIAIGQRADLLQVKLVCGYPIVRAVWCGGRRIL